MQTNAPAGSEFVDQYNRAVTFGQISVQSGTPVTPYSPVALPAVKTPNYVGVYANGASGSATGPGTRNRRFSLLYLPADGSLNTIAFRTSATAPASNINVHLALWRVGTNGLPSDLIVGVIGTTGTVSDTMRPSSISDTPVTAGFHYLSFTPQAALGGGTITSFNPTVDGIYGSIFGKNTDLAAAPSVLSYTATTYNQTTHEAFTFSVANFINMGVRYA